MKPPEKQNGRERAVIYGARRDRRGRRANIYFSRLNKQRKVPPNV